MIVTKWGMSANWKKRVENRVTRPQPGGYFDPNPDLGGDEGRESLRAAMLEGADNQIRDYAPATAAYERLIGEGISEFDARMFIANLVSQQICVCAKSQKPFDAEIYDGWLARLPELPSEEETERLGKGG